MLRSYLCCCGHCERRVVSLRCSGEEKDNKDSGVDLAYVTRGNMLSFVMYSPSLIVCISVCIFMCKINQFRLYVLGRGSCSRPSKYHLIHNIVMFSSFPCFDRLSIVRDIKYAEATIKPA